MSKLNYTDQALEEIRFAVLQKYLKIHGVLKQEVDIALEEWAKKPLKENKKGEGTFGHT